MEVQYKPLTNDSLDEQLAAAQAEAGRLAARKAAIDQAEADARRTTEIEYYREQADTVAHGYRDGRDAAKRRVDELAFADTINLNELFAAFNEFKARDAECGALETHASRLNYVAPLGRNSHGVDQTHVIGCASLYGKLTWSSYLDWVVNERAKLARAQHFTELEANAHTKIAAAGEAARSAAAG